MYPRLIGDVKELNSLFSHKRTGTNAPLEDFLDFQDRAGQFEVRPFRVSTGGQGD
jgi:hypothetical protein